MKAQIISFHCVLKTKLGKVISKTVNHDVLTLPSQASPHQTLSGLTDGLQDLKEGEKRRIDVPAAKGYGFYDPAKCVTFTRERFGNHSVELGDQEPGRLTSGQNATFRVTSLSADEIVLDANHPLAGQDLVFEIEALDVRDATAAEVGDAGPGAASETTLH
jgi:FKBP-type peptidyl-prolyl cis-trans isomerase SlyD